MAEREVDLEEVGFSSKDVLLRLQASCRELMREVLSCNVGATSLQNAEQGGGAVQDHVTLLREKLKAQDDLFTATVDYKLRQELGQDPVDSRALLNTTNAASAIESRIEQLRAEVQALSSKYSQDSLLLDCLQKSTYVVQHMFPSRGKAQLTSNERALCQLLEKQADLVTEVLHNIKAIDQLRLGARDRCREQMETVQYCRKWMHQIQSHREQTTAVTSNSSALSPRHNRLREDLKDATAKAKLLKHCLQCLIFGSGVNWADDEELLQLTLTLGQAQQ